LDDELAADTETDIPNTADFPADKADAAREDRAIYNNRSLLPTTSPRHLESSSIGNIDSATARPPHSAA
jgi:hypothetical protein